MAQTNIGVYGDGESVTFTVSRIPREALTGGTLQQPVCDLRRISYKVVEGQGLMRREDTNITDQANLMPVSMPTDMGDLKNQVAPEVQTMKIEYFGNGSWASTWDGKTGVLQGNNTTNSNYTQQGPPALIKFTFTLKLPSSRGGEDREVTVSHTVAIPSANRAVTSSTAPLAEGSPP